MIVDVICEACAAGAHRSCMGATEAECQCKEACPMKFYRCHAFSHHDWPEVKANVEALTQGGTMAKKQAAKPDTTAAKSKPPVAKKPPPVAPAPTYGEAGVKSRAKPEKKPEGEPKTPIGRLRKFIKGGYTPKKGA